MRKNNELKRDIEYVPFFYEQVWLEVQILIPLLAVWAEGANNECVSNTSTDFCNYGYP